MGTYLLSLDQGTTSSRAILFDREQNILGVAQKEFTQFYPREGWVEHDPMEVWSSQYGVMMEVIAQSGVNPAEIAAIGITNQRETTILWDRATGRPIYNAIVWQCRRTAELVDRLRADGLEEHIRAATGLVPDAYFSATKIKWVLDHVEGRTWGSMALGMSREERRVSSQSRAWMSKSMVREALVTSVAWTAPPVSFHSSQASTVPNRIS